VSYTVIRLRIVPTMNHLRTALLAVLALSFSVVAGGGTAGAAPRVATFTDAAVQSFARGVVSPVGANDFRCTSSSPPVVLVHGTWENAFDTWSALTPALRDAKRCVFSLNFGKGRDLIGRTAGVFGTGPIETSAGELKKFIDVVQSKTGAGRVDLVAHSQGGIVARYYLKFLGGSKAANRLVTLGTTQTGLLSPRLAQVAARLRAAGLPVGDIVEQVTGQAIAERLTQSTLLNRLNAGGPLLPGITYTTVNSRTDELNTDLSQTQLPVAASVTNFVVQDGCEINGVGHFNLPYDPRSVALTLRGLGISVPLTCARELSPL